MFNLLLDNAWCLKSNSDAKCLFSMPEIYINYGELKDFIRKAIKTETTWFKARKLLWEQWAKITHLISDEDAYARGEMVEIPYTLFISIKGVLLSRSQDLNSDKILSFETSLVELDKLAEAVASGEAKGEAKTKRKEPIKPRQVTESRDLLMPESASEADLDSRIRALDKEEEV